MNFLLFTIPVVQLVGIAWVVFFLDVMSGQQLKRAFRLKPRSVPGLIGIVTCPFLHGDQAHLTGNSVAFLVLGSLIAVQGRNMFIFVSIIIMLISGLLVWLYSDRPVVGASGVIYGYLGYLLMFGMTVDDGLAWGAGLIALVTYGGVWMGIFPSASHISWLGHATGFLAGLGLGYWLGLRALELGVYG